MKIFIEKENVLQIDEETKLMLLNTEEFLSTIKQESSFISDGHIRISLKYKLVYGKAEYYGESIFDSYKDVKNDIDINAPYKIELVNWKLSDDEEKYLEFNFTKKVNEIVEITRENYKNFNWNERIKYQYRGLVLECDHEYDTFSYMIWLNIPKGLNYKFSESDNGDLPYKHQFMAGHMDSNPNFLPALEELMDYVDRYYEYFEPKIKNNFEK